MNYIPDDVERDKMVRKFTEVYARYERYSKQNRRKMARRYFDKGQAILRELGLFYDDKLEKGQDND
jgi:hypothetical protein